MKKVLLSQRVQVERSRGERRDALDQAWAALLAEVGLLPQPVPNNPLTAASYFEKNICAVVLTGGNDLNAYGGDAPERDATEGVLVERAVALNLPVLGVCRGMQFLMDYHGGTLVEVDDHVATRNEIDFRGERRSVNSYHVLGATAAPDCFDVRAKAADGVLEAIEHKSSKIMGIMWHPEREQRFASQDVRLLRTFLGVE